MGAYGQLVKLGLGYARTEIHSAVSGGIGDVLLAMPYIADQSVPPNFQALMKNHLDLALYSAGKDRAVSALASVVESLSFFKSVFKQGDITAGLTYEIVHGQAQFGLELVPTTLWSALVIQFGAVITSSHGTHFCSLCKEPYWPERKPRRDRREFCSDECHAKTRAADAVAAYQAKKRSGS
jgi:hypothetical protein